MEAASTRRFVRTASAASLITTNEFDNGASQTSYGVGTFFPLSRFGFEPAGWQIFPMTGYTYSDGEVACDSSVDTCDEIEIDPNDTDAIVFIPVGSSSGYPGAFALKPLTHKWTLSSFIAGSKGSGGYSGYVAGAGTGYAISKRHSFTVFVFTQDKTYGDDQKNQRRLSLSAKVTRIPHVSVASTEYARPLLPQHSFPAFAERPPDLQKNLRQTFRRPNSRPACVNNREFRL